MIPAKMSVRTSLLVMGALLLLDQLPKIWVRAHIPMHHTMNLIPYLIDLTHVENKGVSFSMLGGLPELVRVPILVGISLAAVAVLAYYWIRYRNRMNAWTHFGFVLILAGASGNLIDRAVFGTVTDFFHFRFFETSFFVNNVADILISLGVVCYVIGLLRKSPVQAY
ncbi:MAG: signal peptidase II [SAR324 cluster bacterium]|nr:signal peptidase II [SAR324 cluster bacterium]